MGKNSNLYIVEGEIEKRFIEQLKQMNLIIPGKVRVFNLMQKVVGDTDSLLDRRVDCIFCIIDTDCKTKDYLEKLRSNVKKLQKISKHVSILAQKDNFEGELIYVLEQNGISGLCHYLPVPHERLSELKRYLTQKVNYGNYIDRINVKRYCARSNMFSQYLVGNYAMLQGKVISGKDSIVIK